MEISFNEGAVSELILVGQDIREKQQKAAEVR